MSTVDVTVTLDYTMEIHSGFPSTDPPSAAMNWPMPFVPESAGTPPYPSTTLDLKGAGATFGSLIRMGQGSSAPSPGAGMYAGFATIDMPAILTAVIAAVGGSVAGPVTFTVTGVQYSVNAISRITGLPSPITWAMPDIGAYQVTAVENWNLQPSWTSGMSFPPDVYAVGTITATATSTAGGTSVTYPIRRPPLASYAPGTYPLLGSVPVPSGSMIKDGVTRLFSPAPVLTGTLTGGALTSPFLLALMDSDIGSGTWTIPAGVDASLYYQVSGVVLTIPMNVGRATPPPLWQRQRMGVLDSPDQFSTGLVTPYSSPWQGGTL